VIIQAILDEAAEKGTHDLAMKAVAARAGVAVGSLYQYFPKREGMIHFAVALTVDSLCQDLEAFHARPNRPDGGLFQSPGALQPQCHSSGRTKTPPLFSYREILLASVRGAIFLFFHLLTASAPGIDSDCAPIKRILETPLPSWA
jgi:AcrR family transcriptional regulator